MIRFDLFFSERSCTQVVALIGLLLACTSASASIDPIVSGPEEALPCLNVNLDQYKAEYLNARSTGKLEGILIPLSRLQGCLPERGDLLVELIQVNLELGRTAEALLLRKKLLQKNPPEGILALVDSWVARSQVDSRFQGTQLDSQMEALSGSQLTVKPVNYNLPAFVQLGVSAGYDTNANSGSSAREVQLSIGGIDQILQLSPSSLPQASSFEGFRLDAVFPARAKHSSSQSNPQSNWLLGSQYTRYNKAIDQLSDHDSLIYVGRTFGGGPCDLAGTCSQLLLAGVGQTRSGDYEFINHRFTLGWHGQQATWSTSLLRRESELESIRVGGDWFWYPQKGLGNVQVEAGFATDMAQNQRAGGDQLRAKVGLGWQISPKLLFTAKSEWVKDQEEYSPALFGSTHRNQTIQAFKAEYILKKTTDGLYSLLFENRVSDSNLKIFSSESSRLELIYNHRLDLSKP